MKKYLVIKRIELSYEKEIQAKSNKEAIEIMNKMSLDAIEKKKYYQDKEYLEPILYQIDKNGDLKEIY